MTFHGDLVDMLDEFYFPVIGYRGIVINPFQA